MDAFVFFRCSTAFLLECDDTSHTDDNDMVEMECRSRWGAARGDVSRQSESDSEEDVLHPLGSDFELPLETNYAEEQEEEFGSVHYFDYLSNAHLLFVSCYFSIETQCSIK